ncbi:MAG: hypothetical protein HC902_08325 [Calothrix sp. SM1_5_4]|nr:hypothetical protein [Calothrix sp. SM1_5_4]
MKQIRIGIVFSLIFLATPLFANDCDRRLRAVFDVGSGSTKMNLAEVEICSGKVRVLRTLDDQSSLDVPLEAGKDAQGACRTKASRWRPRH